MEETVAQKPPGGPLQGLGLLRPGRQSVGLVDDEQLYWVCEGEPGGRMMTRSGRGDESDDGESETAKILDSLEK